MNNNSKREYGEAEKMITKTLWYLPSKRLLFLCKTIDQVKLWLVDSSFQKWLALCWRARHTGENDPIRPLLESDTINRTIYTRCWRLIDFYEQLWGLIQISFSDIKAEFKRMKLDFPFETAYELFEQIISDEVNLNFSVCLEPYYEVSGRKYEKAYRLASRLCKGNTLTPEEQKEAKAILKQHEMNPWMAITLLICDYKATKAKPELKSKLKMFDVALAELCDQEATVRRKAGSYAWKDGEEGTGSKDGTYHFP